jgi:hypothetical protein
MTNCITVIYSVFNSHYLRDYTQDIQNHRFRNVWMRTCVSDSVANAVYNFTAGTFKRLNSWVYDINFTIVTPQYVLSAYCLSLRPFHT